MRPSKLLLFLILLLILVSTVFVIKNPDANDDTPQITVSADIEGIDIDDLIKQTVKNTESIERYSQNTEIIYEYSGITDGKPDNRSLQMMMTANVDNQNKILWATINSTLNEGDYPLDIEVEMYSTADSLYVDLSTEGESPGWIRSQQITTSWDKLVSFDNVFTVLEDEVVQSVRNEVDKGKDYYVLTVPVKDVYVIYRTLKNSYGLENQFRYSYELVQAFSDNFIFEIWIDKDSFLVVKRVVRMEVEVTPEQVTGLDAGSAHFSLLMTSYNYNINQAFTINLPEELDDAARIYTINE